MSLPDILPVHPGDPMDLVAYSNQVSLRDWTVKSDGDPKVRFWLKNRDELAYFDYATTRNKRRAGQRYRVYLADERGDTIPNAPDEAWMYGCGWSHRDGAHVALAFTWDAWLYFWTEISIQAVFYMTLVEIQPDETPVDQRKAGIVRRAAARVAGEDPELEPPALPVAPQPPQPPQTPVAPPPTQERQKGGPRSRAVARMIQADDWILWLTTISVYKSTEGYDLATFEGRDALVKTIIKVGSKIELDNGNEKAWTLWETQFHRPFLHWARNI